MNSSIGDSANKTTWWQAALMIRGQTEVDNRNIRAIYIWFITSGLSVGLVTSILSEFPEFRGPLAWGLVIVSLGLVVVAIHAHLRFLRESDEFMRKVQFEGMAIGWAAGAIFCLGSFLLESLGVPPLPMTYVLVPMTIGWAVGSLLVAARYR